jgi:hypothetical protein
LLRVALGQAARFFAGKTREAETEQARERECCFKLGGREVMRRAVVGHELAGKPAVLHNRPEHSRQ